MNHTKKASNKSIGCLFPASKTKEKSPDMTGKIALHSDLIEIVLDEMERSRQPQVKCNAALWYYNQNGEKFVSIEISPCYQSRSSVVETRPAIDQFFSDLKDEQDGEH